jgi:hypothetical protein
MENTNNSVQQIRDIILNDIEEFKNEPRNPELYSSNEFALKVHKKEIFLRILKLIDESGIK